jgi:hypothetical protein
MINNWKHIAGFKWAILIGLLMMSNISFSQNICSEKLSRAESMFELGHLYQIFTLLEECIQDGFTKEEKIKAYRLMAIVYLYLDEYLNAEQAYLSLLRLNPEYKPNQAIDPAELFYLHNRFLTTPRWSFIMARAGINFSMIRPYNFYNTDGFGKDLFHDSEIDPLSNRGKSYKPNPGLTIGSGIKYGYSERFSLTGEVLLKLNRIRVKENLLGHSNLVFNEDQFNLELPIFVNYHFPEHKFRPYLLGGASLNFLFHSAAKNLKIERTQGVTVLPETGPNISLLRNRNAMGYSIVVGGGIHYKVGVNYVLFEVRQSFGLKNIASKSNRYGNNEMLYRYMYIDDDMRMDNLMINVSYVKPFYNPRKKGNK